ncbi:hypothetical protein QTQ03_06030 [Micromonospora sp. WMMA1363]|uniref:hypothetical protein n=1 Tax=Micromonospora sp. WMMA1363 TaxID=3053985 RepID=UPI00259CC48E|nr:hypothetical protein [Micromonospora sp. WMMA1363]MDM4719176.1 hypothetical protein [Micromonospora sp. WMMA1363]
MDVQLLVVADCPNEGPAAEVLRRALDDVGLTTVEFTTRIIEDQDEAEQIGFTGSPSVFIDGRDPFTEPDQRPALACRLYRDDTASSGVPPPEGLRQALRQAADRHPPRRPENQPAGRAAAATEIPPGR